MSPEQIATRVAELLSSQSMTVAPAYLTPEQASVYLQVPIATLQEWRTGRRKGSGPRFVREGLTVRYALKDLEAWAAAHKVGGVA